MRRNILIVEDNADAADSLAELLELWGHEVRVAYTGTAALESAALHHPDVILLDIGLPDLDGFEVAGRLRERGLPAGSILIALTGYGTDQDRRRTLEAGFQYHLVKPAEPAALRRILASAAVGSQ